MLNRAHQPITIDPNNLVIGIAQVSLDGNDLGALQQASVAIVTTVKERYVGYPAQRHQSETESVTASALVVVEEIGSAVVLNLLASLFADLNAGTVTPHTLTMLAPFVGGDNLSLAANAKVLPELEINWRDDWCSLGFKFECIGSNAQTLIVKTRAVGVAKTATTLNSSNLSIGMPKITVNGVSVGALQSGDLILQGAVKRVIAGYPNCTADLIYLNSKFEISVATEEACLPVIDDCAIEIIQAIVDGGSIKLTFPHCKIAEDLGINTQNNWLGYKRKILPFKTELSDLVSLVRS